MDSLRSIYDYDWSSTAPADEEVPSAPVPSAPPEEQAPPPLAPATQRRGRPDYDPSQTPGTDLLPAAYRETAPKNIYKRKRVTAAAPSIYDYDWGAGEQVTPPSYDPESDFDIHRGFKVGSESMSDSVWAVKDMARIATLPADQQVAAMLELAKQPADPGAAKLKVDDFNDVHGIGDAYTYVMESIGQMGGSIYGAAKTGGLPGAAAGAAIGGTAGLAGAGVGAVPGAIGGGLSGFTWGTRGAFMASGVGGTFKELLADEAIQAGLETGEITPGQVLGLATATGAAVGALDAVSFEKAKGAFGDLGKDAIKTTLKKAASKAGLKQAGVEAGTEALQGALSEFSQAMLGGDYDTANRIYSVINSGFVGGLGGGAAGGLGGAYTNAKLSPPPGQVNPAAPAGETSPVVKPADGALDPAGGIGSNGPDTGYSPTPQQPVGVGEAESDKREQGKDITGTPVIEVGEEETDVDVAKTFELEQEGEFAAPDGQSTNVDVDIAEAFKPDVPEASTSTPPGLGPKGQAAKGKGRPEAPAEPLEVTPIPEVQPVASPQDITEQLPEPIPTPEVPNEQPLVPEPAPPVSAPVEEPALAPGATSQVLETPAAPVPPALQPVVAPQPTPAIQKPARALPWQKRLQSYASGLEPFLEGEVQTGRIQRQEEMEKAKSSKQLVAARGRELGTEQLRRPNVESLRAARERLTQLKGNRQRYEYFWDHLHPALQDRLRSFHPDTHFANAAVPTYGTTAKSAKAPAAPAAQKKPQRAPRRPAVALKVKAEKEPVADRTVESTKKTVRMTLQQYRNIVNAQGQAKADEALRKAKIGGRKIESIENGMVQYKRKPGFKKRPPLVSADTLFGDEHGVDTEVTETRVEGAIPTRRKSQAELAIDAMRRHFLKRNADPVQLSSVGLTAEEIAALERAGLAEDGSMDREEFGRWRGSKAGLTVPDEVKTPWRERQIKTKSTYIDDALHHKIREQKKEAAKKEEHERRVHEGRKEKAPGKDKGRKVEATELLEEELARRLTQPLAGKTKTIKQDSIFKGSTAAEVAQEFGEPVTHHGAAKHFIGKALEAVKVGKTKRAAGRVARHKSETGHQVGAYTEEKSSAPRAASTKQANMPAAPGEMLDAVEAAYKEALALLKEELRTGRAAARAIEEATIQAQADLAKAISDAVVRRVTKDRSKKAKDLAKESKDSTRRRALEAYYSDWENKVVAPKPTEPVHGMLWEMGKLKANIAYMRSEVAGGIEKNRHTIKADETYYEYLREQRIAAINVDDEVVERQQSKAEKIAAKLRDRHRKFLDKAVEEGLITADEAMDQRGAFVADFSRVKKHKRAAVTDPIIKKHLKAMPPPDQFTKADQARPANWRGHWDPKTGVARRIRVWAKALVKAIDGDVAKTKMRMPRMVNREDNTPHENMVQYIRDRLGTTRASKDTTARSGSIPGKTSTKGGKAVGAGILHYNFGQDIMDAWLAASILSSERWTRSEGMSEHAHYLEMQKLEEDFYGMILDASKTAATVAGGRELAFAKEYSDTKEQTHDDQEQASTKAVPLADRSIEDVVRDSEEHTAIAEQLKKLFESPTQATGRGKKTAPTTGAEALTRYVKGQPHGQRADFVAALKTMVGDVPVEFISDEEMRQKRNGNSPAGFYDLGAHKIFIHEGMTDSPAALGETVVHEMAHAATAYALEHNIRGTNDIASRLRSMVKSLSDNPTAHALKNNAEFIAAALESGNFQGELQAIRMPVKERAAIRALSRGRPLATMWDTVVAMFENAIGVFSPAGRRSYLDAVLRLYPDVMMSSAEQAAHSEKTGSRLLTGENELFDSPFSADAVKKIADRVLDGKITGHWLFNRLIAPVEHLNEQIAKNYFGGSFDNPLTKFSSIALLEHNRLIEDEMRTGLEQDNELRRWASAADPNGLDRRELLKDAIVSATESSLDRVDLRKTLKQNTWVRNDDDHPLKGGKPRKKPTARHRADTYRREAHARLEAEWAKYPAELRELLSKRIDYMTDQMKRHDYAVIDYLLDMLMGKDDNPVVLPKGMSKDEAVDRIYRDDMTEELTAALGDHTKRIFSSVARLADRGGMYMPVSRAGSYFISGRRNVPMPTTSRGTVKLDKKNLEERDRYTFIFDNDMDASDYLEEMGSSGEERVLGRTMSYINPITGERVKTAKDSGTINGKEWKATPQYRVEVQHRFMAMGDSVAELDALRTAELQGNGKEYSWIRHPIALDKKTMPDRDTLPSQLQALLRDIDNQPGKSDHEKAFARSMVTQSFIRTSQGNRLSKRMLKRQGVAGYEKNQLNNLMAALNSNNEMMSRQIVNRKRLPLIEKYRKQAKDFIDVYSGAHPEKLDKLPENLKQHIGRDYGKGGNAAKLQDDWAELEHRYEASTKPNGGRFRGERLLSAIKSIIVQSYLNSPAYYALNSAGYWLQTFPRLVGEMGFGAAMRYTNKASARISTMQNLHAGTADALAEGREFVTGLLPRKDFKHSRGFRKDHDQLAAIIDDLNRTPDANTPHIIEMIRRLRLRNYVGQAGLDQANVQLDLMGSGPMNKFYRGVEQSMRIFRAFQEGIELTTRLKPAIARLEYYLDQGMAPEQAIEKSANRMAADQTGYAKENWPPWMDVPILREMVMFKKFPIRQALNYWGSVRGVFGDPATRRESFFTAASMTAALAIVGGFSGNPFWEPIRLLMYLANAAGLPVPGSWNVAKTKGEAWMAAYSNPTVAETAMYGLPRLVGIDLAGRVALDTTLLYQQPKENTVDDWYSVLGKTFGGASLQTITGAGSALHGMATEGITPKYISNLPFPKVVRDTLKSYDSYVNGPSTSTGIKTGEPPALIAALFQSLGGRTRDQARPFEQGSAAQMNVKKEATQNKSLLMRRILNNGLTSSNYNAVGRWNESQTDPKLRIKIKDITAARKRRTKMEQGMATANEEAM